jgi:hypothetical protein
MRRVRAMVILGCLLALAPAAAAAGGGWSFQGYPTGNRAGGGAGDLVGVSCSSPDACTAVGGSPNGPAALAERWDGSRWSVQSTPTPDLGNEFSGVSCPTAHDCVVVGGQSVAGSRRTLLERWNGRHWAIQQSPSPRGAAELRAVSCASRRACIAVGAYAQSSHVNGALAERWDGTSWAIQRFPKAVQGSNLELNAVSCSSASACTAVGTIGGDYYPNNGRGRILVLRWNGRVWSVQHAAGTGRGVLLGVSCPSARWCVAVGFKPRMELVERWNERDWSLQQTPHGLGAEAVSCTSARACTATGGDALRWNGQRWSQQRLPAAVSREYIVFDGVSCPLVSDCTAVGHTSGGTYDFVSIAHWTG